MSLLFTYGTLRSGRAATHKLYDYNIYSAGAFPYIALAVKGDAGCDVVLGNLVEVSEEQLKELDRYENCKSGLFERQQVEVFPLHDDKGDESITAWVYVGGTIVPQPIASGDWLNR